MRLNSHSLWRDIAGENRAVSPVVGVVVMVALVTVAGATVGVVANEYVDRPAENYEQFEEVLEKADDTPTYEFAAFEFHIEQERTASYGHRRLPFEFFAGPAEDDSIENVDEIIIEVDDGNDELTIQESAQADYVVEKDGDNVPIENVVYEEPRGDPFDPRIDPYERMIFELGDEITVDDESQIHVYHEDSAGAMMSDDLSGGSGEVAVTVSGDVDILTVVEVEF